MEAFCQADPAHAVEASYWDADPWKLGTPGGTVDLKTGRVLEADPAHRITKLTAVGPGKSGECPGAGFNSWTNRPAGTPN